MTTLDTSAAADPAPLAAPAIYNYDRITGVFLSVGEADANPIEPADWLIPAHATTVRPPNTDIGQVAIMTQSSGWQLVTDQRGLWYKADGQSVEIDDVQADVAGLVRAAPPSPDHQLVSGHWELSAAKVQARFTKTKNEILAQARAQREIVLNRLMGVAFAANAGGDTATVSGCLTARQALLDLTKHASIVGATSEAQLKSAYKTLYTAIVAATPAAVRTVYADIQL
jgi:hypothetical protein